MLQFEAFHPPSRNYSLGQTPHILYNVKKIESMTKNIITLVMLIGFSKFQLDHETLDFSYPLKQILRKLVVF